MMPAATIAAAHKLKQFVNRKKEFALFEEMLAGETWRLLCVHGKPGIGKTFFLGKIIEYCRDQGLGNAVYLEWRPESAIDYLSILYEIRDQSGLAHLFNWFNDQVNKLFSRPGEYRLKIEMPESTIRDVRILEDGRIEGGSTTIHVGENIEISDVHLTQDRSDSEERRIPQLLTEACRPCIAAAAAHQPLVVILDNPDKADSSTKDWIWSEFIPLAVYKKVEQLYIVFAIENEDPVAGNPFADCSSFAKLEPFDRSTVSEYLARRGVRDPTERVAEIMEKTSGQPLQVGLRADVLILDQKAQMVELHV